jgi:hypothetical protein
MNSKLLVLFAIAGLAVASAKSYTVTLYQPAMVGSTELKAGEYRLEVVGDKAVIRNGRVEAESPVKLESGETKFRGTSMRFTQDGGKMHIQSIRLGGTSTTVVFEGGVAN